MRFSGFKVIKEALCGHKGWKATWRDAAPKSHYDYIIIGGGGHGLATAYYLARRYGKANIAVVEKGWLGGGNVGRNTTIIRSNYMLDGNEPFYELSLQLWEGLEQDLNYNAMVSQRGILNLFHTDAQRDAFIRRGNAMLLNGADADLLTTEQIKNRYPFLNTGDARFPIKGGLAQHRGGTVRHDAVAWGYARAASLLGVDIIQNCEVTGIDIKNNKCVGVITTRGPIKGGKIACCVAGSSSRVMAMAGMRLPIESHVLQAFVSEGLKPLIPGVITFGAGHFYCSQSDKVVWYLAAILMVIIPMHNAAICLLLKMSVKAAWRFCQIWGGYAYCECGAASWICRWMGRQSLTKRQLKICILMGDGVMAVLRQRQHLACVTRIFWPPAIRMRQPRPIDLTALKEA